MLLAPPDPGRRRISAGNRGQVGPSQCPVEQGGHAGFGQSLDGHGQALLGPLHPVHVLLQVGHSLGFDVGEHRIVGRLLAEQALKVPVELPHTDQQGRVVALDLGQAEVDPGIEGVGGRLIEEVGQLTQPVTDGVEDRRLQPHRVLEAVEGVEEAADSCLTLGRQ